MPPIPDWLLVTVQWVHHLGAVAWVGGAIFYRFVLQRAFRTAGAETGSVRTIGHEFGRVVRVAIVILVVTGAFLAVVHLSAGGNSRLYIGILALKISLAFYMFLVVWLRRRAPAGGGSDGPARRWPRIRRALTSTTVLLILGVVVIGLADVLGAVGHGSGGHSHGGDAGVADDHHGASEDTGGTDDHHGASEDADAADDHHGASDDAEGGAGDDEAGDAGAGDDEAGDHGAEDDEAAEDSEEDPDDDSDDGHGHGSDGHSGHDH